MAAVTGAQRHGIPRISLDFSTQVKYFTTNPIMVRDITATLNTAKMRETLENSNLQVNIMKNLQVM